MNAICQRVDGRYVMSRCAAQPAIGFDAEDILFRADAVRGSAKLRDAILRAKGYPVPQRLPKTPRFRKPSVKKARSSRKRPGSMGRPKKVRTTFPKIALIQKAIAEHYGCTIKGLLSHSRKFDRAHPRQVAIYAAKQTTNASLTDIALHFGGRDHTTILHAIRKVESRIANQDQKTILGLIAVQEALSA